LVVTIEGFNKTESFFNTNKAYKLLNAARIVNDSSWSCIARWRSTCL